MLDFMYESTLFLSVFIRFAILKGILTYKKEGNQNQKIVFYILLLFICIISKLYNINQINGNNSNNLIDITLFSVWGIYYIYFYKIGYIKYIISFCLFNVYYDLFYITLNRALFMCVTGYSSSSEESLLISDFENQKIQIYAYILTICIYFIIIKIVNHLQLFDMEKRNYIYLFIALLVNIINIIGRYTLGIYSIGENLYINTILHKWRKSVPILYDEWGYFDQIVVPKLVGASIITIILLFRRTIKENKVKFQNELMQNKLDMQYSYYLNIQESHMKVKRLYHDINNHIYCIGNMKNNNKEIDEYVSNLKDELKEYIYIYNTGNMILDIIINEKHTLCTKKGIKFICDINFSKVDFIKPIDISSIFANILDNSIEACDKICDEDINKYIRIKGTISKSYFVLKCENSKVNIVKVDKNILLTDKLDKFIHGIGIQSIKSSLEKYNGEILFEEEKEKFTLNIYIPLNQNTDSWVD